jgi:phosphatidylglycerophosphate synthase
LDPYAVTIVRLPLAALGIALMAGRHEAAAIGCFVAFALIDIVDGQLARRAGKETALRRVLDVVIDRVAIQGAVLVASLLYGLPLWFFGALLIRDLIQAKFSADIIVRDSVVFVGPSWHMAYGLSVLTWGLSVMISGGDLSLLLSAGVLIIAVATLVDFRRLAFGRLAEIESKND